MKKILPVFLSLLLGAAANAQTPCTLSLDSIKIDTSASSCNRLEFKYKYSGGSPVKYKWTYGDGNSCNCIKPKNFYTSNGSFQVCGRIEDAAGCADSLCVTVQVNCTDPCDLSGIGIYSVDTLSYSCREFEFITITSSNAKKVRWDFGDGDTADSKFVVHEFRQNGSYRVRLIITDSISCADTSDLFVDIDCSQNAPCDFQITAVDTATKGDCKTRLFRARTNQPGKSYWWQFGDMVSGYFTDSVLHTYLDTGNFTACLYASDSADCRDTFCMDVRVVCPKPSGLPGLMYEQTYIYPNPFEDILTVNAAEKGVIHIYDPGMRKLMTLSLDAGENILDLRTLEPGTYFLQTVTAGGTAVSKAVKW